MNIIFATNSFLEALLQHYSYTLQLCSIVSGLEWTVFVCNHQLGPDWRRQLADKEINARGDQSPTSDHQLQQTPDARHRAHASYEKQDVKNLSNDSQHCASYFNEDLLTDVNSSPKKSLLIDTKDTSSPEHCENDTTSPALISWVMKNS